MKRSASSFLSRICLSGVNVLPYALLLLTAYLVFGETADDPFITFRYAWHTLSGHGPVFNIGERVEGFTSPLHLLVCIFLLKLWPAVGMLFKAKLFSLLCGMATVWQTKSLARQIGLSLAWQLMAQALVVLNINFALVCVNGLETTLYAFVLMLFVSQMLRDMQTEGRCISALLLFFALLARPEAMLIFAALLLLLLLRLTHHQVRPAFVGAWAASFLMPFSLFLLARFLYYGLPLPNTYYAKSAPLGSGIKAGLEYLLQCLSPSRPQLHHLLHGYTTILQKAVFVNALLFWGLVILGWAQRRQDKTFAVFTTVIVAVCLFNLRSGGDWMSGWRFVAPVLPILSILQCYGIAALASRFANWRRGEVRREASTPSPILKYTFSIVVILCWLVAFLSAPRTSWADVQFSRAGASKLV